MNYTTNYHLPQWVETDRIMMEDFNQMCEDIDGGIAAAKAAADSAYSAANKPYVIGRYTGNGPSNSQTITLGFRPAFLVISSVAGNGTFVYSLITDGRQMSNRLSFTDTGFTVTAPASTTDAPNLNYGSKEYCYIAFR